MAKYRNHGGGIGVILKTIVDCFKPFFQNSDILYAGKTGHYSGMHVYTSLRKSLIIDQKGTNKRNRTLMIPDQRGLLFELPKNFVFWTRSPFVCNLTVLSEDKGEFYKWRLHLGRGCHSY